MVDLFVEACAGTGALSIRLQGGHGSRPLVSRMGSKVRYADAILDVLGLSPGQGASKYVWCDPEVEIRHLLSGYSNPALLKAAAVHVESWSGEDPRSLWSRLYAEGPVGPTDPREYARWVTLMALSFRDSQVHSGFGIPSAYKEDLDPAKFIRSRADNLRRAAKIRWPTDMTVLPDARDLPLSCLTERSIVYMDPPYVGTTGYKHDLPRSEVVRLAEIWKSTGALVCISEATPIEELVEKGWYVVDITNDYVGARSTFFGKHGGEFLTMSRESCAQSDLTSMFAS